MADSTLDSKLLLKCLSKLKDDKWLSLLSQSARNATYKHIQLPQLPPDDIQIRTVGMTGFAALKAGFDFYLLIKKYVRDIGLNIESRTRLLDFGCGWGRILRFFLKDTLYENLFGIDVDPGLIDLCRRYALYGNYEVINPLPPTVFPDTQFDIIFAYSVFSHLAEDVHLQWIKEFSRIMKPGGLLFVTSQGRTFIDDCDSLKGQKVFSHPWHAKLSTMFPDPEKAKADYDAGIFLHLPTGGGDYTPSTFYGETLIPPLYVKHNWVPLIGSFVDFIDDRRVCPQAVIIMRK